MDSEQYVNCELLLTSSTQARLVVAGREYSGRPNLGRDLERQLLAVTLDPVEYGRLLFEALFSGESGELLAGYRESLTLARHQSQRLRFRLHIADSAPPELHAILWELLYDPGKRIAFSRSQETAFSRYLGVAFQATAAVPERPKILVVSPSPTDLTNYGLPDLDPVASRSAMEKAFEPLQKLGTYEFLDGPATVERIRDRLVSGAFHVLHLQAHGLQSPSRGGTRLVLERQDGSAHCIDEDLFSEVFEGQRNLRLAVLASCHGGAPTGTDPFSGLGPALVWRGIPAVVAMRHQISLEGATRFSEHFYRNLMRSGQVDAAANEARLQMHLAQPGGLEWATPALFMRLADGRLWNLDAGEPGNEGTGRHGAPEVDALAAPSSTAVLKTLLVSDLVGSTRLAESLGDERLAKVLKRVNRSARDLLSEHKGQEIDHSDGFLMLFERPFSAVCYALALHRAMAELSEKMDVELRFRIGIHLGEIMLMRTPREDVERGAQPTEVEGLAKPIAARLMSLAQGGQVLLSAAAFNLARRSAVGKTAVHEGLRWIAHGEYHVKGVAASLSVYEVGVQGMAPLVAPPDTEKVRRVAGDQTILGWRPGIGLEVPLRRHWVLTKKLSRGGFGEVWLARHEKLGQLRAFKFCFEAERLQALQREITLFRLLKEELGDRDDIARILDWNFDEAPYFIESEVATDGDLVDWSAQRGGLERIPLADRLELVAQVATALAAAHSVGVLHKDVKPRNVLVGGGQPGTPQARLADFGIGMLTERDRLEAAGITSLGLSTETERASSTHGSSSYSGTRLYMAPELLEGKRATLQSDIYALGVLLFQIVVGDFTRALAPGWRRNIEDELIREDIAAAVDGSPERRLGNALRVAERLRSLPTRRLELEAQRQEREDARQAKEELFKVRRRRKLLAGVIVGLSLFAGVMTYSANRIALEAERANQEARRANQEAERANQEAEKAQQVSQFMVDLFEVSDPAVGGGATITARELLDQAATELPEDLEDQPLVRAELMATIGAVYQKLGLYASAEPLFEQALSLRLELLGETHPKVAKSHYQLALLYRAQGRDAETIKSNYLKALEVFQALPDGDSLGVVDVLRGLGVFYYQQGLYDQATLQFQEAMDILESLDESSKPAMAMTLNNLALIEYRQARYEDAASLYQRALEILEVTEGTDSPRVTTALENLGLAYAALQQNERAEQYLLRCLDIRRQIYSWDHPEMARVQGNLAMLRYAQERYEEARELILKSLEIKKATYNPSHYSIGLDLKSLAGVYLELGRAQEAESNYLQSLEIFEESLGVDHVYVAATLDDLSTLYSDSGRLGEAEAALERALTIRDRSLAPGHPEIEKTLRQMVVLKRHLGKETEALEIDRRLQDAEELENGT